MAEGIWGVWIILGIYGACHFYLREVKPGIERRHKEKMDKLEEIRCNQIDIETKLDAMGITTWDHFMWIRERT